MQEEGVLEEKEAERKKCLREGQREERKKVGRHDRKS